MVDDFDSWNALLANGANMTMKDSICASTPMRSLVVRDKKFVLRDLLKAKRVAKVPKYPNNAESLVPMLLEHGLLGK